MKVVVRCDKFHGSIFRPSNERDEKEVFLANLRDEAVIETLSSKGLYESILALPETDKSVLFDAINGGVCISEAGKVAAADLELKDKEPISKLLRSASFIDVSHARKSPIAGNESSQSIFARKLDPLLPLAKTVRIVDRYFLKNLTSGRQNGTRQFLEHLFKFQVPNLEIITTDPSYFEEISGRTTGRLNPTYIAQEQIDRVTDLVESTKAKFATQTSVQIYALRLNGQVFPHDRYGEVVFQVNRLGFSLGKGAETFFGEQVKGVRTMEPMRGSLEIDSLKQVSAIFTLSV